MSVKTRGHLRLVHSVPVDDDSWMIMDDSLPHQIRIVRAIEADACGMGIAVSCSCRKTGEDTYVPFETVVTPASNVRKIWLEHLS
jgi:hypothetical protein